MSAPKNLFISYYFYWNGQRHAAIAQDVHSRMHIVRKASARSLLDALILHKLPATSGDRLHLQATVLTAIRRRLRRLRKTETNPALCAEIDAAMKGGMC